MALKLKVPSFNKLKIKRPTITERMHGAHIVIFFDPKDGVQIHKNRYSGETGKLTTSQLIDLLIELLVHNIFEERMKLFKFGMAIRLKKEIKKIVKEGA